MRYAAPPGHHLSGAPDSTAAPPQEAPATPLQPLPDLHYSHSPLQRQTPPAAGGPAPVIQRKTTIQYGKLKDFTFRWGTGSSKVASGKVGSSMHAELDPADPKIGSDTSGSNAFATLFDALQAHTPTSWVRGHLLNHDLGGLAIYNNLFPITTAANGEHYHEVEKHVKHWVANKCKVDYDVDAVKKDDDWSPDGAFICNAKVKTDPLGKGFLGEEIQKVIYSHGLGKATTDRVSRKKGTSSVNKYSGVQHGDNNTVLRDDHGTIKTDSRWAHKTGTASLNNQKAKNIVTLDPIELTDWSSGNLGDDIEAGAYDSEFDEDAFEEWLYS